MDPREQALMVFGVRVAAMIAVGAVCAATAVVGCMVTGAAVNAVDSAFFGCPEGQSKTSCAVVGGLTGAATAGFGKIPGGASAVGSMLRNGIEEGVHGIGVEYLDDTGRITPGTIAKSVAVGAVFGGAVRMGSHAVRRSGMTLTRGFIAGNSPHGSMLRGRSAIPDVTIRNTAGGFIAKRLRMIRADPERGSIGGQWPTPRRATALSTRSTFSGSSAVSGLFSVQGEQVECSDRRRTTLSGTGATTRSS